MTVGAVILEVGPSPAAESEVLASVIIIPVQNSLELTTTADQVFRFVCFLLLIPFISCQLNTFHHTRRRSVVVIPAVAVVEEDHCDHCQPQGPCQGAVPGPGHGHDVRCA